MISNDNHCILSNEFKENVATSWQELQIEKDFCDITLACEDGKIETHRIIISSYSPVLRNILKGNHDPHPLLYIQRVKYSNLLNLLNFMYQGEVNVAEEDLPSFLEIAEDLNIRQLSERTMKSFNSNTHENIESSAQRKRTFYSDGKENINIKSTISPISTFEEDDNNIINEDSSPFNASIKMENKVSVKVDSMNKEKNIISTRYLCDECDYKAKQISNLKRHLSSIHEGKRYPCDLCNHIFTDKANLQKHVKSIHEGKRYPCDQCDYKATQASNLLSHKVKHHTQ